MRVIAWTLNGLDMIAQNAVLRTSPEGTAQNTFWLTTRSGRKLGTDAAEALAERVGVGVGGDLRAAWAWLLSICTSLRGGEQQCWRRRHQQRQQQQRPVHSAAPTPLLSSPAP